MWTIDFETEAIGPRPMYPPKPVGVAVQHDGEPPVYIGWGHPEGNNASMQEAKEALFRVWSSEEPILCHNAKFDLDVAEAHFGLPLPSWDRVHDTLFLLFLDDPHARKLGLKPASERYLGMKPDERDAVRDWLVEHGVILPKQNPGPFISKACGSVVGPYACGDVARTYLLWKHLYPRVIDAGMGDAYDRERRLMPVLLRNERRGLRVDVAGLERDLPRYEAALAETDRLLRARLGEINLDSGEELADALERTGVVTVFEATPTGRRATSKKSLTPDKFGDPAVWDLLHYRKKMVGVLSQSMRPWLDQGLLTGRVYTEWNQVRGDAGTKTGRLSCSRFQNISKGRDPGTPPAGLPEVPVVRRYLLPEEGSQWCHADYSQQEFRILAHFEDAEILDTYRASPAVDYHDAMGAVLRATMGAELGRSQVKALNFGLLYGMGAAKLAASLGVSLDEAARFRYAQRRAAPGIARLDSDLKARAERGEPVRTLGGRLYYCEPPAEDGRTFGYKLLNYLIQGSAADMTKEALIQYDARATKGTFLVTVHDEINVSGGREALWELREIMESPLVPCDVKMLTDGKMGPTWGDLKKEV